MKLSQIAAAPQLELVQVSNDFILQQYGEPVEFYTWDRVPTSKFVQIASTEDANIENFLDLVSQLVLDEQGQPIFNDGVTVHPQVLTPIIEELTRRLGKSLK